MVPESPCRDQYGFGVLGIQETKRIFGVKRGDVLVFIHPLWGDRHNYFIKRCVGLPGDTFLIKNGVIWANGQQTEGPGLVKRLYRVRAASPARLFRLIDSLEIIPAWNHSVSRNDRMLELPLTRTEEERLLRQQGIDSVVPEISQDDPAHWVDRETACFAGQLTTTDLW